MIDTKELRAVIRETGLNGICLAEIFEILDRLEAVEQDRRTLVFTLGKECAAVDTAKSECLEQARLLSISRAREAALMAKLEAVEQERDALRARIGAMEQQVPICRAEDLRHAEILLPSLGLMPEDKLYALPGAKGE